MPDLSIGMAEIVLDGVSKRSADGFEAVKDMNLDVGRRGVRDPGRAFRAAASRPRCG